MNQEYLNGWAILLSIILLNASSNSKIIPGQTALEIMLKQYPDRPKTLEILRDRFANDPDEQVRKFAQKQLAKLEKL
jgi:hypothetical protein